jgi:hypothetical protein
MTTFIKNQGTDFLTAAKYAPWSKANYDATSWNKIAFDSTSSSKISFKLGLQGFDLTSV